MKGDKSKGEGEKSGPGEPIAGTVNTMGGGRNKK